VHGHVQAIRAVLFWAAREELIDEKIPKRIALPKREQKVLKVLDDKQLDRTAGRMSLHPLDALCSDTERKWLAFAVHPAHLMRFRN
jgi:hypothetical protein